MLTKFIETEPEIKSMNIIYHDLYYTVFINIDDKEIVNNKKEHNENAYINFGNCLTPNQYIGRKNNIEILR